MAPAEASNWLIGVAERGEGRVSEEAVLPAVVARDVEVWSRLTTLAKRRDLREETRKQAIFWLGQEAAEHALGPLEEVLTDDPDREMRQSAPVRADAAAYLPGHRHPDQDRQNAPRSGDQTHRLLLAGAERGSAGSGTVRGGAGGEVGRR